MDPSVDSRRRRSGSYPFGRPECDHYRMEDTNPFSYGYTPNSKARGVDEDPSPGIDATVVLRPGLEIQAEHNLHNQPTSPSLQNPLIGLDSMSKSHSVFPGEHWTNSYNSGSEAVAHDRSVEGFDANLRTDFHFDSNEAAIEDGYFFTENAYETALPNVPSVDSDVISLSTQNFSPFDRYGGRNGTRSLIGIPRSSSLTVPSSAGPSTYAASDVCSDQGYGACPSFGQSPTERRSLDMPAFDTGLCIDGNGQLSGSCHSASGYPLSTLASPSRDSWHSQAFSNYNPNPLFFSGPRSPQTAGDGALPDRNDLLTWESADITTLATYEPPPSRAALEPPSATHQPNSSHATDTQRPRLRSSSTTEAYPPQAALRAAEMRRGSSMRRSRSRRGSHLSPRSPLEGMGPPWITRSSSRAPKGKRNGRMTAEGKAHANKSRRNKDTCIRCKFKKTKCELDHGCRPCRACAQKDLHCVRYEFKDLRKEKLLDFVAHFRLHLTSFGSRSWIGIAATNEISQLLQRLQRLKQHASRVKFSLGQRSLYEIDISSCCARLENLIGTHEVGSSRIDSFYKSMDDSQSTLGGEQWLFFHDPPVDDPDPNAGDITRMISCNEMIAWHTFALVDGRTGFERWLYPNDPDDGPLIQAVALLSRHISYRVETAGFKQLHSRLCNTSKDQIPMTPQLMKCMGELLQSLRRRLCIWQSVPDMEDKASFVHTTKAVCKILYFHYFQALNACPSASGQWSTEMVWADLFGLPPTSEDLPTIESADGFDSWLARGSVFIGRHVGIWESLGLPAFYSTGHFNEVAPFEAFS